MSATKLRNRTAVVVAAALFFGLCLSSSRVLLAQQEQTKEPSAEPPPQPLRSEPSAALREERQRQFAAVEREVARLRVAGKKTEAEQLAAQWEHFRERSQGKAPPAGAGPELHVVGLYEGNYPDGVRHMGNFHPWGHAVVDVYVTDRPVILALCSYEPVKWRVRLAKGVRLQKVILGGYHDQLATGLAKEIPVEKYAYDAGTRDGYFYAYRKDREGYANAVRRLKKLTNLDVATFQGMYAFKDQPFVIGPQNGDWHVERILAEMADVSMAATAFERAGADESVQAIRFPAIHWTPGPHPHSLKGHLANFTPTGPIATSMQPLPERVVHVAIDPKGPAYYGIASHSVVRIDLAARRTEVLPMDAGLPELSWPCGLSFDTKRRRLVLTSLGGVGHMYAYDPDAKKWSLLTDMNNIDLQSFTYSAEGDCFYGLELGMRERAPRLFRFGADGKSLEPVMLGVKLPDYRPPLSHTQLVCVGRQLVLLTPPGPDPSRPALPDESRSYLIDPATGKTTYSGVLRPHAGKETFVAAELDKLWEAIKGTDTLVADVAMWKLAAGHDQTVKFLRGKLAPLGMPESKRVQELVMQLDDQQFAVREKATAELYKLGPAIEAELRAALKMGATAETERRLMRLLERFAAAQQADPELLREQRALQVLVRMDTTQAVEYLRELAAGPAGAARTRLAEAMLQQMGKR